MSTETGSRTHSRGQAEQARVSRLVSASRIPVTLDVTAQQTVIILFIASIFFFGQSFSYFYLETKKLVNTKKRILEVSWLRK